MSHQQNNHSFQRSQSADLTQPQPRILLMTHSTNFLPSLSTPTSFQRRTVEGARQLRDSLTNVIREIEPLVETARTVNAGVSSFLNRPQSETNIARTSFHDSTSVADNDSIFINVDFSESQRERQNNIQENPPIQNEFANNINGPVDNNNAEDPERLQTVVEAQQILKYVLRYVPFILILLAKSVYDYHEGIFILLILFITFAHTNSTLKKEIIKRQRRSILTLGVELLYIVACLLFIHFVFSDNLHYFNIILNLVLVRTFTHPLTVWNLLWIVTITDFSLKLITITAKILLTMLPAVIVEFKKRVRLLKFSNCSLIISIS